MAQSQLLLSSGFIELSREEAQTRKCRSHAVHCMIYSKGNVTWEDNLVMIQMRYDGSFGFIGGFVDSGETWEQALNRELHEELGMDVNKHKIKTDHYVYSAFDNKHGLCLHFYAIELTRADFCETERLQFNAKHFGHESLGVVRIPLYTRLNGNGGLPTFLCNQFVGNAREQLLRGLKEAKLCDETYLTNVVNEAEKYLKSLINL